MAHELRLMLLLADESGTAARRDAEAAAVRAEAADGRREVVGEVRRLMGGATARGGDDAPERERHGEELRAEPAADGAVAVEQAEEGGQEGRAGPGAQTITAGHGSSAADTAVETTIEPAPAPPAAAAGSGEEEGEDSDDFEEL